MRSGGRVSRSAPASSSSASSRRAVSASHSARSRASASTAFPGGHGHEPPLLSALRDGDRDPDAAAVGEVRGELIGLGREQRRQDGARDGVGAGVVLRQERAEDLRIGDFARALDDEVLAADELAVADLHDLDAGFVLLAGEADDVVLGPAERRHLLLFHGPLDGAKLVPADGCLLVAQRGRVGGHLALQVGRDRLLPAVQEVHDLADRLAVLGLRDGLDARPLAAVDVVEQAGPLEDPLPLRDVEVAGAEREDLAQQLQRLVHAGCRCVRAEVATPVALEGARAHDAGEVLAQRDLHERIALVVPQPDVEARSVLLDEVRLEQVRLRHRVGDDVLDVGDLGHHPAYPSILRSARTEVRTHPAAEHIGLADVQHAPVGVLHEVDTRTCREAAQDRAQRVGKRTLRAHASILGPRQAKVRDATIGVVDQPEQPMQVRG